MNLSEALLIAAAIAVSCACFIGEKIIKVDFSGFLPKNRKSERMKKLLIPRETPLQGERLHGNIRKSFEQVLIPLGKADKSLLPARMDRIFRRKTEKQIELLKQRQLCRDIRLADVVPLPKNDFKRWNDDGREWRESVLQCNAVERLVPEGKNTPIYELYHKNAYFRIVQSRHIRNTDRIEKKKNYYGNHTKIICPSCGAEVKLSSQKAVCSYCGGVLQSDFYDWQTEKFDIYEKMGMNLRRTLQLLASVFILFVCVFLCLWLIQDIEVSLAAGVVAAILIMVGITAVIIWGKIKQEKRRGEIVRYSENYLRSCIGEVLYEEKKDTDLMDYSIGTIILKKVVNTDETTKITIRVYVSETYLPEKKRPYTKKAKKKLTLQRARYPERRKEDGAFLIEKDCPSCGANFIPDANHCCSFCGYGLQVDNAKWVAAATEE